MKEYLHYRSVLELLMTWKSKRYLLISWTRLRIVNFSMRPLHMERKQSPNFEFLEIDMRRNMAVVRTRRGPRCLFQRCVAARRTPLRWATKGSIVATINVVLNYLGVPVPMEYLDRLADGADHSGDFEYRMIRHVLDLPPEHAARDVLERYVEVSGKETYTAIFPHTDKLFDRILVPLKSSKRMYCFGEYLACIELSAHLGEMLALLLWQITPIALNGKRMDAAAEKSLWGSEFEKMGQEKRIDVLKVFGAISDGDAQILDFLRATRRKYFHFWSTGTERIRDDALQCFLRLTMAVQNILQIQYDNDSVKLNPLLDVYLAHHKAVP